MFFFFSSRRRHTICALVTGVQTCALPISFVWHYQDVNICAPFALPPECAEGNCVSAQITRDMATLRDRHAARIDRLKALAFLIHFVGDLHQPLHAGEKGDAGGNKVNAAYGIYAPPRLNLHSLWDGPDRQRCGKGKSEEG